MSQMSMEPLCTGPWLLQPFASPPSEPTFHLLRDSTMCEHFVTLCRTMVYLLSAIYSAGHAQVLHSLLLLGASAAGTRGFPLPGRVLTLVLLSKGLAPLQNP